ncbi:nonstructural protein 1 [Chaphamaparvovirus chiropteran1]|uniref:Nonstructural protein 1 n=1 Tax=Desmodus rotundus parvovirus TaxID=1926498 RepID=A0A1L4AJD9_9VIRU|nr:nonstructural protein 1 [Desmodus rotundus parvovirus]API68923.1 nonstructural protein 1 [Desmodus rotundus parvovirus]
MQAQVERPRASLSELRRYWWNGHTCLVHEEEKTLDLQSLQTILNTWDSRVWQACVLAIWDDALPVQDPRPYAFLMSSIPSVKMWFLCAENDSNGNMHIHLLALTPQRSDSFKRTLERIWKDVAIVAMSDIEMPDPTLEVVKCQKCHKPSSLISYMVKDPIWIAASDLPGIKTFQSIYQHDLGERFRARQEIERIKKGDPNTAQMHTITAEITDVIMNHNCRSVEDCMRAAPDIIAKHLHRAGLATIIQNCIAWVTSTGGGWSMQNINAKYPAHPDYIHLCLIHQGITPQLFDPIFYQWVTKANLKKNTLVLWGPTNTGKSAFISGFKQCINWGEVVNSNTFAFEGLINNQFGIWEEPLISPELAEKAKQVFEGMETSIPVKYRKPVKLPRTPIIITTNHAPWRFCTKEEEMFKNRMFIFNWNHNMHNTTFTYRVSEYSCECRICKTSRSSETTTSGGTTSSLPGGEQPIQQLVPTTLTTSNVPTRSMSPPREREMGTRTEAEREGTTTTLSRSNSGTTTQYTDTEQEQCSDSSRSSSSSSTTTPHSIRSGGEYRSSHTTERDGGTSSGSSKRLGTRRPRRDYGRYLRNDGHPSILTHTPTADHCYIRRPIRKRKTSQEVVVLGKTKTQKTWPEIPTTEPRLDREMGSLTIPTRLQWYMYLSYLQTKYG